MRVASKEEYDVLRLIEHGQTCYISSECVEGWILAGWLKSQTGISKGRLFALIRDLTGQLGMLHKCRKKPCYQYVNPYSIVVTEEGRLYFLDLEAGSNEKQLKFMQKRAVRECFLPAETSMGRGRPSNTFCRLRYRSRRLTGGRKEDFEISYQNV